MSLYKQKREILSEEEEEEFMQYKQKYYGKVIAYMMQSELARVYENFLDYRKRNLSNKVVVTECMARFGKLEVKYEEDVVVKKKEIKQMQLPIARFLFEKKIVPQGPYFITTAASPAQVIKTLEKTLKEQKKTPLVGKAREKVEQQLVGKYFRECERIVRDKSEYALYKSVCKNNDIKTQVVVTLPYSVYRSRCTLNNLFYNQRIRSRSWHQFDLRYWCDSYRIEAISIPHSWVTPIRGCVRYGLFSEYFFFDAIKKTPDRLEEEVLRFRRELEIRNYFYPFLSSIATPFKESSISYNIDIEFFQPKQLTIAFEITLIIGNKLRIWKQDIEKIKEHIIYGDIYFDKDRDTYNNEYSPFWRSLNDDQRDRIKANIVI